MAIDPPAIASKLVRLRTGGMPRLLDLFAGCGGLSLGFQAAGFEIKAAVESDHHAARSHGINFHGGERKHSRPWDIVITDPWRLAAELELGALESAIDVIVG